MAECSPKRRLRTCVENWPGCYTMGYDPACCRFPKSCSATVYDEDRVAEDDLEPPPSIVSELTTCAECIAEAAERRTHAADVLDDAAERIFRVGRAAAVIGSGLEVITTTKSVEVSRHLTLWHPPVAFAVAEWLHDRASTLRTYGDLDRTADNEPALRLAQLVIEQDDSLADLGNDDSPDEEPS